MQQLLLNTANRLHADFPALHIPLEYALLVAIISVTFAVYFGQLNVRRNRRLDDTNAAASMAKIEVCLQYIEKGVDHIRHDMKAIKDEISEHGERITLVESSTHQAHKRLDEIAKRKE